MQRSKFITGFFLILLLCNFQDAHARGVKELWNKIVGINEPTAESTPISPTSDDSDTHSVDTKGVRIFGPKGETAFFYNKEENIIAVECEDHTNIRIPERRLECMENPERMIFDGPVSSFEGSLKMVLKLPMENYNSEKIELYNNAQSIDIESDSEKKEKLESKITDMEGWKDEFGAENADTEKLEKLQQELAEIEAKLGRHANLDSIREEIDGKINRLIGEVTGDGFVDYIYSEDKETLAFNMLRGVLNYSPRAIEFVEIEAAGKSFKMGSPEDEDNRDDDENGKDGKQVEVNLTKDFEMMTTEVTQQMWFDIMKKNPSRFSNSDDCNNHIYLQNDEGSDVGLCPNHPVERVSWDMVQVFIEELNSLYGISGCDGTPESSFGCFRLPTEGEWEFAARARTITAYYFDADLIDDYAWYGVNSDSQTHPVGKLASNDYGLFDMSGNVWEWTQDSWQNFLVGGEDPLHASSGSERVIRGGSWISNAQNLRSANRDSGYADYRYSVIGFRLVRTL